ncbi:MAG: hypothetical protein JW943_15815 [Deltaproteobacteria bacterium]|nr:hypothetical protein [Deltaproteobacteria bacterium]
MKSFPLIQLIALVLGGIILYTLKRTYQQIRNVELIVIFILYFMLIAILTEPGLEFARRLVELMQVR